MRKHSLMKKIVSGMMALSMVIALIPSMSALAASEYTVTFRPGNVGQFGIASDTDISEKTAKEMAQEVADIYYAQYETTVTENGAIKIKIPAGADMPVVPGYIIPEAGYCVRSWGPRQGAKVTKNVDYVVDYGRLTDGVEYTVKYVDEESGESIAPFMTAYANIGDSVTVNAPAVITTSDAGEYILTSTASQELVLVEDAASNVITFNYAYSYNPGTVTQEVIVTVPGDTVVVTETYTTYVDNTANAAPGAVQLPDNTQNEDTNTDNQEEQNQVTDNQGTVEIEEEAPPLEDSPEDSSEDVFVNIEDEQAPLSNQEAGSGMNTVLIWVGVLGVAAVALMVIWLQSKRKKKEAEE